MSDLKKRIVNMARMAEKFPCEVGVLSTGERCAVGLLCNDADMLPTGYSFIDAVERLESDWIAAILTANRDGWREEAA